MNDLFTIRAELLRRVSELTSRNFAVQYAYVTEPEDFLPQNHRLSVNFYFKDSNPIKSIFGT